jgi:hypothetical protein
MEIEFEVELEITFTLQKPTVFSIYISIAFNSMHQGKQEQLSYAKNNIIP